MAGIKASIHRIADDLWAIDEIGNDIMYLIDGGRRALLIDTGYGMVDLKALSGQLCPGRELMVVNSHMHPDHASGNAQFGQVFCGRYDEPRAHRAVDGAVKRQMMSHFDTDRARAAMRVETFYEGKPMGAATVKAAPVTRACVPLDAVELWELGKGRLYDTRITLLREGAQVDCVEGYFGMRKVELRPNGLYLNDRPVFMRLVLDQGFYP